LYRTCNAQFSTRPIRRPDSRGNELVPLRGLRLEGAIDSGG